MELLYYSILALICALAFYFTARAIERLGYLNTKASRLLALTLAVLWIGSFVAIALYCVAIKGGSQ